MEELMISIPKKGTQERDRLIAEHKACIESMKGVPGCTILRCATVLNRVLLRMRAAMPKNGKRKLVVICTNPDKTWRIGRLSGVRGVPPEFVNDTIYNNEQDPQHDIFLMRLDEMDETDGMPQHFHEGWKRRDDNWTVT